MAFPEQQLGDPVLPFTHYEKRPTMQTVCSASSRGFQITGDYVFPASGGGPAGPHSNQHLR
jgi:hypothetical protein